MRLENYLKFSRTSKKDFIKQLRVSSPTLYNYTSGRTVPAKPRIMEIMKLTDGLVMGGDFYRDNTPKTYAEDMKQYAEYLKGNTNG